MRPKYIYLMATSFWYMSWGIQSVVFAWLVTMVMREPAERVGTAQMALLLPGTLLILIAGATADRVGLLKQAIASQILAAIFPCLLALALFFWYAKFWADDRLCFIYGLFFSFPDPSERRFALICGRRRCPENNNAGDTVSIWLPDNRLFFSGFCRSVRG